MDVNLSSERYTFLKKYIHARLNRSKAIGFCESFNELIKITL